MCSCKLHSRAVPGGVDDIFIMLCLQTLAWRVEWLLVLNVQGYGERIWLVAPPSNAQPAPLAHIHSLSSLVDGGGDTAITCEWRCSAFSLLHCRLLNNIHSLVGLPNSFNLSLLNPLSDYVNAITHFRCRLITTLYISIVIKCSLK